MISLKLLRLFTFSLLVFFSHLSHASVATDATDAFLELTKFGDNPGELTATYIQPSNKTQNIVVLLHGCVQNGQTLAKQSGLLALASQRNFTLLIPQQSTQNNIKQCFNWFSPLDNKKDAGESLSIVNMIAKTKLMSSAKNVYIVGLSAGGALTSALLANYPALFDGGAVIAGIPYPCADNLIKAISCMRSGPVNSVSEMISSMNSNDTTNQKWPKLSIWYGSNDKIVSPKNAEFLAQQWVQLNNLTQAIVTKNDSNYQISVWHNKKNVPHIELVKINNMGHGMPVNPAIENGGSTAPFLPNAPLSAAIGITNFWQL